MVNVGKNTSPMDPMGYTACFSRDPYSNGLLKDIKGIFFLLQNLPQKSVR